jgi:uncharacterized protein (TIGR00251 family)
VDLAVKVQPAARRPAVGGLAADGAAMRVAVAAPATDGRANRAVCDAVARALGRPNSAVKVLRGASAHRKTLRIAGDPSALIPRLEALLA